MASTIDKYAIEMTVRGEGAVKALDNAVNNLGTRLAQLGIAAFITNAYRMADAMKDLADATGLTSGYVKTFADGLQKAGGDAASVDKILTTFYRTLEDMAAGSDSAERAFAKLGVTFQDLRTLSERDILKKSIERLAEMKDGAERVAAGMAIFGKSFATIDPRVMRDILATGNVELLTAQLNQAAAAVGAMEANYRNLQMTAIGIINGLVGETDKLTLSNEALAKTIKIVAALMLVSFGATLLRTLAPVVTMIIALRREFLKTAGAAAILNLVLQSMGGFSRSKLIGGVIAGGIAAAGIKGLYDEWQDFSKLVDQSAQNLLGLNAVASDLDGLPMTAMKKYSDGIKELQKQLQAGKITQEQFNQKAEELAQSTKNTAGGKPAFPGAGPLTEQQKEAQARAAAAAIQQTNELRQQFELQSRYQQVLNDTIGIDENRAALQRELAKIQLDYDSKRLDYQTRIIEELGKGEETNQKVVEQLSQQLADLNDQQAATEALARDQNTRNTSLQITTSELQKQLNIINTLLEKQKGEIDLLRAQRVISGILSEEEAEYLAERETIIAESDSKIAALNEQLKNEINDIKRQELEEAIRVEQAKTDTALKQMERRREAEREMEQSTAAGTKKVFEEMRKSVSPYQVAVDSLQSAFRSVDNALTEFVTKGKFSFKEFTRSLLADIALIIARALVMRAILAIVGAISPAAGAALGTMMGIPGKASGGPVSGNRAYIVGEKGPEMFMPATAGTIIPNNQLAMAGAGGGTNVTYNINAVDASSFRSLVARDPQFIYNVTEVGRRSSPSRRLA